MFICCFVPAARVKAKAASVMPSSSVTVPAAVPLHLNSDTTHNKPSSPIPKPKRLSSHEHNEMRQELLGSSASQKVKLFYCVSSSCSTIKCYECQLINKPPLLLINLNNPKLLWFKAELNPKTANLGWYSHQVLSVVWWHLSSITWGFV